MRAKVHIESIAQRSGRADRTAIIVTELPYLVNKAALLEKIAAMVNDKKLDGERESREHVSESVQ